MAADVRRVAQVPEVVLDEPEHRVGDDVVEAVVGLGLGLDEPHAEGAALGRLDLERLAAVLARDVDVLLGHRAGDPDRVAVGGQPGQRGHEPARAALDRTVLLVRHWSAVRDQDEGSCSVMSPDDIRSGRELRAARNDPDSTGRGRPLGELDLDDPVSPPRWISTSAVSPGLKRAIALGEVVGVLDLRVADLRDHVPAAGERAALEDLVRRCRRAARRSPPARPGRSPGPTRLVGVDLKCSTSCGYSGTEETPRYA